MGGARDGGFGAGGRGPASLAGARKGGIARPAASPKSSGVDYSGIKAAGAPGPTPNSGDPADQALLRRQRRKGLFATVASVASSPNPTAASVGTGPGSPILG